MVLNVEHSPNDDDDDYSDEDNHSQDNDHDDNACLMRATATRAASDASRAVRRHG